MTSSKNIPLTVPEQFTTINGVAIQVNERDYDGNVSRAKGIGLPTGAGYAKGCRFLKLDSANSSDPLYYNYGDASNANFTNYAYTALVYAIALG